MTLLPNDFYILVICPEVVIISDMHCNNSSYIAGLLDYARAVTRLNSFFVAWCANRSSLSAHEVPMDSYKHVGPMRGG